MVVREKPTRLLSRGMRGVTAAAVMAAGLSVGPAHAQDWEFVWASGSVGGTFNTVVTAVAERLKAEYPDVNVDIIPGGSVTNTIRLARGDFPIAMITSLTAKLGYEGAGLERFEEEGPYEDIRGVAAIYNQHFQFIAPAELEAETIDDVIEKKMQITIVPGGPRGHIGVMAMQDLLDHVYGLTLDDLEDWGARIVYAEFGDTATMIRDGQVDLFTPLTAAPNGAILDLANARPIKFLGMREESIEKLAELGYVPAALPAETYPGQTEDIPVSAAPAAFYARADADEGLVKAIVEVLLEHEESLKNVHVRLEKDFNAQTAHQGLGVPLHPGAEAAYREAGLID